MGTSGASDVKILLARTDHIGDLVLTTPLIRALARAGHAVEVVVPRALRPVLEENPHVREVFSLEEIAPDFPRVWRPLRDWMRGRGYDCVLLPNACPRALLFCSLGSGAPRRLAMQAGILGRLTFHRCLKVKGAMMSGRHFSDIALDLARALGVAPDGLKPDYFCREEELAAARRRLTERFPGPARPLVGIHPGCAGNTCNLAPEVYGDLARLILERTDWNILVTGSAGEAALLQNWPAGVSASPRVERAMGTLGLRELAATIRLLNAYVIVGTGPLHLASALGVATVSPFCALPPIAWSNWGNLGGPGVPVEPTAEGCRRWQGAHSEKCRFRGEVTAEDLWRALEKRMKASPAPATS